MICEINGRKIGPDHPPYIIAEMSANHNGSIERAFETIRLAAENGAHAVKMQTYTAETMTIDCDREEFMIRGGLWDGYKLYDLYRWAETPFDWHKHLFDYARSLGVTLFSTPFDETAVDLLETLGAPAYKVASFEATDLPLIRYVARTGKPMIISTGMCSEVEIDEAVSTAKAAGCEQLILLHCISSYPAPIDQANLRSIPMLAERFDAVPGLSDHTMGTTVAVAAVALGACVIEKHFTISRNDKGPDSEFSLEPIELKRLVEDTRDAWSALGKASFQRQAAEVGNRQFRRSLYFVRDLAIGEQITAQDIRRIRPGLGLEPKYHDLVVGKKIKVNVSRGTPVSWEVLLEE